VQVVGCLTLCLKKDRIASVKESLFFTDLRLPGGNWRSLARCPCPAGTVGPISSWPPSPRRNLHHGCWPSHPAVQWDIAVTCASVQIVNFYTEATDEVPWIIPLQYSPSVWPLVNARADQGWHYNHMVRHLRCVFINYNWINQLSNTTIWWLDMYVVYYIGINYMFRLLWPSSGW